LSHNVETGVSVHMDRIHRIFFRSNAMKRLRKRVFHSVLGSIFKVNSTFRLRSFYVSVAFILVLGLKAISNSPSTFKSGW
jgi:hypothetical protein